MNCLQKRLRERVWTKSQRTRHREKIRHREKNIQTIKRHEEQHEITLKKCQEEEEEQRNTCRICQPRTEETYLQREAPSFQGLFRNKLYLKCHLASKWSAQLVHLRKEKTFRQTGCEEHQLRVLKELAQSIEELLAFIFVILKRRSKLLQD